MSLLRYGRDFYTDAAAQQLMSASAWLLVAIAAGFIAVHLIRRSAGHPVATMPAAKLPPDGRARRYEVGARLYHWGNAFLALGLAVSGTALFSPGVLGGGSWLLVHEVLAVLFAAGLALHVAVAPRRGEGRSMWFDARDGTDLRVIAANFVGRTREYPAFGKYDPWQKIFHALLALLAAALVFSGTYLLLNAEAWMTFGHPWMRSMRLLHDVSAYTFAAVLLGHVYFGVIRVNWPQLVSMCTGRLRGSSFNRYHDAARWLPRREDGARR